MHQVPDYTEDSAWRRATDAVRERLRGEFDQVTLLADSLDFGRTPASGFDGIASTTTTSSRCSGRGSPPSARSGGSSSRSTSTRLRQHRGEAHRPGFLLRPPRFEPDADALDWLTGAGRTIAVLLGRGRIRESLQTTVGLQVDASLVNAAKGFFLVYVNSFNEWHEGHQFEPMKSYAELRADERAVGYHNAFRGSYRMDLLRSYMARLIAG